MSESRTKAFLVTRGAYSDYGVVAVFTERKLAEEFLLVLNSQEHYGDEAEIEEWPLNVPKKNWATITITMDKDGNVISERFEAASLDRWAEGFGGCPDPLANYGKNHATNQLTWHVRTKDRERAVKVVSEKRAEIMAAGIWGDAEAIRKYFGAKA